VPELEDVIANEEYLLTADEFRAQYAGYEVETDTA